MPVVVCVYTMDTVSSKIISGFDFINRAVHISYAAHKSKHRSSKLVRLEENLILCTSSQFLPVINYIAYSSCIQTQSCKKPTTCCQKPLRIWIDQNNILMNCADFLVQTRTKWSTWWTKQPMVSLLLQQGIMLFSLIRPSKFKVENDNIPWTELTCNILSPFTLINHKVYGTPVSKWAVVDLSIYPPSSKLQLLLWIKV